MNPFAANIFFIRSVFHVHLSLRLKRTSIFSHVNWRMFIESLAFTYTRLTLRTKKNFSCGGLELNEWYTVVDRNPRDGDTFINPSWSGYVTVRFVAFLLYDEKTGRHLRLCGSRPNGSSISEIQSVDLTSEGEPVYQNVSVYEFPTVTVFTCSQWV